MPRRLLETLVLATLMAASPASAGGSPFAGGTAPGVRAAAVSDEAPSLRLAAVAVVAENFDAMLEFYRDTLGFEVVRHDVEGQFVELESGDVGFHLMAQDTMKNASGYDGFHGARSGQSFELAFRASSKADVDRIYQRILEGGGRSIAAPADKPWGQRIAFFADPDGNIHDVFADP